MADLDISDVTPPHAHRPKPNKASPSLELTSPEAAPVLTFDELYRTRYQPMVRLAYVLVDTTEDAEQVVQEAFIGLYRRFDTVENTSAYLRTSVVNGARKVLRRRRVARRAPTTPPGAAEMRFNHVFDAIRRLPGKQRELVALRYEQQMTDAEIARMLSLPIGTVKSRLHRAIAELRKEIT